MTDMNMTSNKPYLFQAFYDWIVDNGLTPYLLVQTKARGVVLPEHLRRDEQVLLNISPRSVQDLYCNKKALSFNASFSGQPYHLVLPVGSWVSIYAKENGNGMMFTPEDDSKAVLDEGKKAEVIDINYESEADRLSRTLEFELMRPESPTVNKDKKTKAKGERRDRSHLTLIDN